MTTNGSSPTLAATEFLDHDSTEIRRFVDRVLGNADLSPKEQAVELYYAVRDDIFYDVYGIDISRTGLRASSVATSGQGFCLHKSVLYAAATRAVGVPSRLVFGDVRNHLASGRLRDLVGGEIFFHALTAVYLDGRWVKATPVFNKLLCKIYKLAPLEFDGNSDSMNHPFDDAGGARMEFLQLHGEFDDLPYEFVHHQLSAKHPAFVSGSTTTLGGSLVTEANSAVLSGDHHA
ncbi:transglutaminase-like domain-containing protein [Nocardia sp. CA-129566]|uniref:transglutaminase-like domain-containing protein n=1 Tax=Nocardia sp. CA-129566 TaxID=3239976 RepID=UPI003D98F526